MTASLDTWLERLGYTDEPRFLHRRGDALSTTHPYALEIHALLKDDGSVRARAVFDVEGVPTIVFLDNDDHTASEERALDEARKRIWNQNLASVVIHVQGERAVAHPARRLETAQRLQLSDVRRDGPFSASDVVSARLTNRMPTWFDQDERVDHKLLGNISATVRQLAADGFVGIADQLQRKQLAEFLMGEIFFVSYLEHREIVGATYRERRNVGQLLDLVANTDRRGVQSLIDCLRDDFNGDFLGEDSHNPWTALSDRGYQLLHHFLLRTDMQTGQGEFWNYDFSYIPVELLSGLYEMFLSRGDQTELGAFYTPRHLAALAVDQALGYSPDPLAEKVFDGACGSGILLTTAYRRLLAIAEERAGVPLAFADRCALLQRSIFGGDINPMACRVTAFSLYLSIFEGLDPADILETQERDEANLPSLDGPNLAVGPEAGDFFSDAHAFATTRFSLVISNPPWREPERDEQTTADRWRARSKQPCPRRQIAGAYALRALDFLDHGGLISLILPVALLLGHTSAAFVTHLLRRYQPFRVTNFGDLQELLFPTARHACHLFVGRRRAGDPKATADFREAFEYCVPKADLTLTLGHLTMQSADLHRLQTVSVSEDPQQLVSRMWGDGNDLAIWTRLCARGTLASFARPSRAPFNRALRKGIHLNDSAQTAVSAEPLRLLPHLRPEALKTVSPVLHPDLLESWPRDQRTVVGLSDAVTRVFDGPRVVFPDGVSQRELNIRAYYYDAPATFTHSIGVLAGRGVNDAALLKFLAVYLRSSLAQYFLMLRAWKMLGARGGFHLREIRTFPFFEPPDAPNPDAAQGAMATACGHMDEIAELPLLEQRARYQKLRQELDHLVYAYFDLSSAERDLVRETTTVLLPSIRPASLSALRKGHARRTAHLNDYRAYAKSLLRALTLWRTRMDGEGTFTVTVTGSSNVRDAPCGIVRIDYSPTGTHDPVNQAHIDDDIVHQTLEQLHDAGLRRIQSGPSLSLVPDTHVWLDGSLYLVRPATKRSWTIRQALRDAEHIVRIVQSGTPT
ncbi:MAG: N-6 DNA methylase [Gammaproteobacteria bacterium]|nr:N-6 DNA methylase [Gammaproteobacteria bacterium]